MKIEISNVNIEKLMLTETKTEKPFDEIYLFNNSKAGIAHNLLMQLLLNEFDVYKTPRSEALSIFKEKIVQLNEDLELGLNTDIVKNLNAVPPSNEKDPVKWLIDTLTTDPYCPDPVIIEAINDLRNRLQNSEDIPGYPKLAKEFYFKNIMKVNDKQQFADIMSIVYHSAKLYSNDEKFDKLLKLKRKKDKKKKKVPIGDVIIMDGVGYILGGLIGAVLTSGMHALLVADQEPGSEPV